jgi:perosamine synthetase
MGVFSFNGNKTVTSGGGGAIVAGDADLARLAKHMTTTAKIPHAWEFNHDRVGYNYRMPNLNAALACAQLEQLEAFIEEKRFIASAYASFFAEAGLPFIAEPPGARSNYWLNAILLPDKNRRDAFLTESNAGGVQTRPAWNLLCDLPMYRKCLRDELTTARFLSQRLVNIPSGVRP